MAQYTSLHRCEFSSICCIIFSKLNITYTHGSAQIEAYSSMNELKFPAHQNQTPRHLNPSEVKT